MTAVVVIRTPVREPDALFATSPSGISASFRRSTGDGAPPGSADGCASPRLPPPGTDDKKASDKVALPRPPGTSRRRSRPVQGCRVTAGTGQPRLCQTQWLPKAHLRLSVSGLAASQAQLPHNETEHLQVQSRKAKPRFAPNSSQFCQCKVACLNSSSFLL